jgi:hypothetical protein
MGDNAEIPYVVHEAFNQQDLSEADLPSCAKNPPKPERKIQTKWLEKYSGNPRRQCIEETFGQVFSIIGDRRRVINDLMGDPNFTVLSQ